MTNVSPNHSKLPASGTPASGTPASGKPASKPPILGIWRIGQTIHDGPYSQLSLAQPADAAGSPRWDYVIRRGTAGPQELESRRQIAQYVTAAAEASHPNLVAVLDASTTAASPYLVMPRLAGATMQWHLEQGDDKPLPVCLWLVRQIAQALDALHAAGWVHGDVKPENAIVGSRGHVTLVDLGFAARIHTVSGSTYRGTPDYSAPESLSGEMASMPAMDVFSLGRILWQWMIRAGQVSQSLLEPVAELVEVMVAVDPSIRPTAAVIAKHLLQLEIETLGKHIGPAQRAA